MSRQDKVVEAIRQEASVIIHDKLKDPRLGFVTVTKVEIAADFRFAKIYYSVLGNDEAREKTKEALNSALGYVRKLIAERLNLKFAPEIAFYEDRSTEYSVRIEEVLNEIKAENKGLVAEQEAGIEKEKEVIDEEDKPKKSRPRNKKT
jgi:ribosome-binding factor A